GPRRGAAAPSVRAVCARLGSDDPRRRPRPSDSEAPGGSPWRPSRRSVSTRQRRHVLVRNPERPRPPRRPGKRRPRAPSELATACCQPLADRLCTKSEGGSPRAGILASVARPPARVWAAIVLGSDRVWSRLHLLTPAFGLRMSLALTAFGLGCTSP